MIAVAAWLWAASPAVIVDRFEGRWAILETARGERRVLRTSLPRGAREGDVLRGGRIDRAATRRSRAQARALVGRLRGLPARRRAGRRR